MCSAEMFWCDPPAGIRRLRCAARWSRPAPLLQSEAATTNLTEERDDMINFGKCPHCQKTVSAALTEAVSCNVGMPATRTWKGVSHLCPSCKCVLSVSIDPIALKADIVDEVLQGLGKARR